MFGLIVGGCVNAVFFFVIRRDSGDGDVEKPDFFKPAREGVLNRAGNGDEVIERTGEVLFVNGHVCFDTKTLAGRLEPEDCLPHNGTKGTPLFEFELGIYGFLEVAELLAGHFVSLNVGQLDERGEGGDDDDGSFAVFEVFEGVFGEIDVGVQIGPDQRVEN